MAQKGFYDALLANFTQAIPHSRECGMVIDRLDATGADAHLPYRPEWLGDTGRGLIHTGIIISLVDTVSGLAALAAIGRFEPVPTLDLRMDYLRPAKAGSALRCDAHCHRLSRSVAFVRGEVFQEGSDEAVAAVNATFMLSTANVRRRDVPTSASATPLADAVGPADGAPQPQAPWHGELAVTPELSPYAAFLGIERQVATDGLEGDVYRMPFKPELIGNPVLPALHGGVVGGFAETAALLHLIFTNPPVAGSEVSSPRGVDFAIDYLRSAKPIDTFARCTTIRQGSRVALVHVTVWQDDPSRPIVSARSHCLLPRH